MANRKRSNKLFEFYSKLVSGEGEGEGSNKRSKSKTNVDNIIDITDDNDIELETEDFGGIHNYYNYCNIVNLLTIKFLFKNVSKKLKVKSIILRKSKASAFKS